MRDDKGNIFVVFRGTSSATDAATDLDFIGSIHPKHSRMFGGKGVQVRRAAVTPELALST